MKDKDDVIKTICGALSEGNIADASDIARREYPFFVPSLVTRNFNETQALRIFVRDGFVDRYSGKHLLFPPVLRLLSFLLPKEFPFHRNWKMKETHPIYWERFPTLDHIIPIARGGTDDADNLISTSMLRNSAKANWTLEELDWSVHPPGDMDQWDGMLSWFVKYMEKDRNNMKGKYLDRWYRVARSLYSRDFLWTKT
ncbi:MAG: HNH endonuclease signature motif containing protein [Deltaproteobacteria bacterium]|nr:HNH endonuclease signature motif containing protein [Deltaproteobacteria bacterium]